MKTAPTFSQQQMAFLKALLTPDCCHISSSTSGLLHAHRPEVICRKQKADAYDKLCRYIGFAPAAKPADGCAICATLMKERAKETNRTRMRATRAAKKREGKT